jgi:hypothetical protein
MSDFNDDAVYDAIDVEEAPAEPEPEPKFVQLKAHPDFEISKTYPWIVREIATGRVVAHSKDPKGYAHVGLGQEQGLKLCRVVCQ